MPDNIILNLGSGGDTLAADDDGTAKHQQVKVGLVPYAEQQLISHSIISVWTMTTPTGVSGAFSALTAIQL